MAYKDALLCQHKAQLIYVINSVWFHSIRMQDVDLRLNLLTIEMIKQTAVLQLSNRVNSYWLSWF